MVEEAVAGIVKLADVHATAALYFTKGNKDQTHINIGETASPQRRANPQHVYRSICDHQEGSASARLYMELSAAQVRHRARISHPSVQFCRFAGNDGTWFGESSAGRMDMVFRMCYLSALPCELVTGLGVQSMCNVLWRVVKSGRQVRCQVPSRKGRSVCLR